MQHTRKRTRGATQNTHVLFRGHTFTRATLQEARSAPDPRRPGFHCQPLNLQAHDVGQFTVAVDEFPRVRQDTAALLRTTGLDGAGRAARTARERAGSAAEPLAALTPSPPSETPEDKLEAARLLFTFFPVDKLTEAPSRAQVY